MAVSPSGADSDPDAGANLSLLLVLEAVGPTPSISERLVIDTTPGRRLVVPDKCEDAGERELLGLARTGALEEAFAFIPGLCTWIDLGVDQTASTVRVDRRLIDELVAAFGSLIVYHTHRGAGDGIVTFFPAYSDLIGAVLINSRYLDDRTIEIRHRAMTPDGLLEYSFHPSDRARRIIEIISSSGLGRFAGENLSLAYAGAERQDEYHRAVRRCAARSTDAADGFTVCFPLRVGDFIVDYREPQGKAKAASPSPE